MLAHRMVLFSWLLFGGSGDGANNITLDDKKWKIDFVMRFINLAHDEFLLLLGPQGRSDLSNLRLVYWSPPPIDVIKINVDGSCLLESLRIGVGGLDKGRRNLIIESDCLDVVNIFTMGLTSSSHKYSGLVKIIKVLLAREWVVSFLHVYRDGNKPVDWLACQGARVDFPVKWLDVSPPAVDTLVVFDSISRL
ncbi:Ribonuclease H-like superfamily [Sesbania bispinosa]|nr:Ribonuclease H-like superfamily [Sesbania bispinosa]